MDFDTGRWRFLVPVLFFATVLILVSDGCISNQGSFNNLDFEGYVMRQSDSTVVPGALIIIYTIHNKGSLGRVQTDADGFYNFHITLPTGNWDPLNYRLTVADMDGDTNGIFVSRDTVVYDDNSEHELNITFEVDFYVQMIEDTTAIR